ncbi:unnamed protein product [Closterium sp. Yama58-4]|nr:unnamed protein product [Closterium sp. Yama58-4]
MPPCPLCWFLAKECLSDLPTVAAMASTTRNMASKTTSGPSLQEAQRLHLLESPWIGISLRESTDRIHGKHLILYATFFRGTAVVNEFLTLITIDCTDAASLTSAVVQYLTGIGLDLKKITGISTDGANVMVGKNNGIVAYITLVARLVQHTIMRLKNRYLNMQPDHHFGSGEKMTLKEFIQRHQKMNKREMRAEGVDSNGNPVSFTYTLHEKELEGQETDGDVTACYELSLKFARAVDKELKWHMRDLEHLEGTSCFALPPTYETMQDE